MSELGPVAGMSTLPPIAGVGPSWPAPQGGGPQLGTPQIGSTTVPDYASWMQRASAAVLDGTFFVVSFLVSVGAGTYAIIDFQMVKRIPAPWSGTAWTVGCALVLGLIYFGWNYGVLQGRNGATWGKRIVGIEVVDEQTGRHIGVGDSLVRQVMHGIDAVVLCIGFLMPLWDSRNRTIADAMMSTIVVVRPRFAPRRARIAVILTPITLMLALALVVGTAYLTLFRDLTPRPCSVKSETLKANGFALDTYDRNLCHIGDGGAYNENRAAWSGPKGSIKLTVASSLTGSPDSSRDVDGVTYYLDSTAFGPEQHCYAWRDSPWGITRLSANLSDRDGQANCDFAIKLLQEIHPQL